MAERYYSFLAEDPDLYLDRYPDLLGCRSFAESIAGLIAEIPHDSIVGLWGDWGTGKSRILHQLREVRPKEQIIAEFNPWTDADGDNWIARLTSTVLESLPQNLRPDEKRIQSACVDAIQDFTRRRHINLAKGIIKAVSSAFNVDLEHFEGLKSSSVSEHEIQCLQWEATMEEVKRLLEKTQQSTGAKRPFHIVVTIDDLDRCEPSEIRAILDTCFTKLRHAGVTFVVCADRNSVVASLTSLLPPRDQAAEQYLEKLISIDLTVPEPTAEQVREFVTAHLNGAAADGVLPEYARLKDYIETHDDFRVLLVSELARNPRRIKRILVRYLRTMDLLLQHLDETGRNRSSAGDLLLYEFTICLTVLREIRPRFSARFLREPVLSRRIIALMVSNLDGEHLETKDRLLLEGASEERTLEDEKLVMSLQFLNDRLDRMEHIAATTPDGAPEAIWDTAVRLVGMA